MDILGDLLAFLSVTGRFSRNDWHRHWEWIYYISEIQIRIPDITFGCGNESSRESWQWVKFCDPWLRWPM